MTRFTLITLSIAAGVTAFECGVVVAEADGSRAICEVGDDLVLNAGVGACSLAYARSTP